MSCIISDISAFADAALPWIALGIGVAVWCAYHGAKKDCV